MREKCPICGALNREVIIKRNFYGMQNIVPFSSYTVNKCCDCGMIYAGDIVEEMPLAKYYSSCSKYETEDFLVTSETKLVNERIIALLEDYINEDDNILEIGCGTGHLLYQLQRCGYKNLTGIEPSKMNVDRIVRRWNIPSYTGVIGERIPEIFQKKYKLIVMEAVLEHVLSLGDVISQITEHLEIEGYLFLGVPDITDWCNIEDLYQQFSVEHVNYFSLQSLNNLLGMYGFRCIRYEVDGEGNSRSIWKYNCVKRKVSFANDGDAALYMYLKKSSSLAEGIKNKLASYKEKRVYLWGAGTHTAMLYQLGLLDDIRVLAIIDSNKNYHGKTIFGLKVISPEEMLSMEKLPIIISSQLAQESIREQIAGMCDNEVVELY